MFVIRDTYHPQEDLDRNWSAPIGGFSGALAGSHFSSIEDAQESAVEWGVNSEFRFHPAYDGFVEVHYEGLGAWAMDAETLEEALIEADEFEDDLACTTDTGDGHFYADDCIGFHFVREGRYIFELK